MRGMMMDAPLLITGIMRFADRNFPAAEVVSITADCEVARWWIPDDVVFVTALPHTATGKLAKNELRRTYADYRLPETEDGS